MLRRLAAGGWLAAGWRLVSLTAALEPTHVAGAKLQSFWQEAWRLGWRKPTGARRIPRTAHSNASQAIPHPEGPTPAPPHHAPRHPTRPPNERAVVKQNLNNASHTHTCELVASTARNAGQATPLDRTSALLDGARRRKRLLALGINKDPEQIR